MISYRDWISGELDRASQDYGEYKVLSIEQGEPQGDEMDMMDERELTNSPF